MCEKDTAEEEEFYPPINPDYSDLACRVEFLEMDTNKRLYLLESQIFKKKSLKGNKTKGTNPYD